jgi:hypothetical protein
VRSGQATVGSAADVELAKEIRMEAVNAVVKTIERMLTSVFECGAVSIAWASRHEGEAKHAHKSSIELKVSEGSRQIGHQ